MEITVIIPAYNEEKSVAKVIEAARNCREISRVIVVNDGSTDHTAEIARENGAEVIDLPRNMGKGAAVAAGVKATSADIVLLLDADLVGLRFYHLKALLQPLLRNEADMTIGVFQDGRPLTDLSQRLTPFLSGQRAIRREIVASLSDLELTGFGVDFSLSRFAKESHLRVVQVHLKQITQILKEEKRGLLPGLAARAKMYWEILLLVLGIRLPPQ